MKVVEKVSPYSEREKTLATIKHVLKLNKLCEVLRVKLRKKCQIAKVFRLFPLWGLLLSNLTFNRAFL